MLQKIVKGYFLIIACCYTRAIYVRLTPNLSLKSFLLAYTRFILRCCTHENFISDNLKTFKAAEAQIFTRYLQIKWN